MVKAIQTAYCCLLLLIGAYFPLIGAYFPLIGAYLLLIRAYFPLIGAYFPLIRAYFPLIAACWLLIRCLFAAYWRFVGPKRASIIGLLTLARHGMSWLAMVFFLRRLDLTP